MVPNETVLAVDIEGADVLPAQLIEDEFKDQYGQPLNFARVENSRHTIDGWYRDRYLDGMVRPSSRWSLQPEQQYKTLDSGIRLLR